jgi:hypothetical protein
MEYLIGSLVTILIFFFATKALKKDYEADLEPIAIKYSQSNVYELIKPYIVPDMFIQPLVSQSTKHYDRQHIRVVLSNNKAYWIMNNVLYMADEVDGAIDKATTQPVDTINMDKVQLEKVIVIVEALTEGGDGENWSPRN